PYFYPADRELLGAHRMQSSPLNPEFKPSDGKPVQKFALYNTAQMFMTGTGELDDGAQKLPRHPGLNRCQSQVWGSDQFTLFPHFIIQISFAGWWLHRFWPIDVDRSYWEAVFHYQRPHSLRNRFALNYTLSMQRDTLMEDNLALVQQQQVMGSGVKEEVTFGDPEGLCAHQA